MNLPTTRIKPGPASLIGGFAVTVASFVLWLGVTHEMGVDTAAVLALGVCVAAGIGIWIRLADL